MNGRPRGELAFSGIAAAIAEPARANSGRCKRKSPMHRTRITVLIGISAVLVLLLTCDFSLQAGEIKGSGPASTSASASVPADEPGNDPDLPAKSVLRNSIDKEEYLRLRDEFIASLRGLEPGK